MKKNLIYRGRKISSVGFFGLGKSNLALFRYLSDNYEGLSFTLRSDAAISAKKGFSKILCETAAREDISEQLLFFSPSVRRDAPEFCEAADRGVILSSDVEFFFENKKIPVFSVTGSDGKSTTASLASLMLSADEYDFPPSANIGTPITSLLNQDKIKGTVAELSSFQLMSFTPKSERALITNVSQNHLDWHTTFDEYVRAKENALRLADKRIFNLDCPTNLSLSKKYPAYAVFSRKLKYSEMIRCVTANHYFSVEDGSIVMSRMPILSLDKIRLSGEHNLSNFLAAIALSAELTTPERILRVAESFDGLSHRARLVGTFGQISYYDSSIDSTPTRTKTTLKNFSTDVVLILGGKSKGLSYAPLFPMKKNIKAIILTGQNRGEILKEIMSYSEISGHFIPIYCSDDFRDAVLLAINAACAGDAVLLSPASTSFDSFTDYRERGNTFSDIIKKYYAEK